MAHVSKKLIDKWSLDRETVINMMDSEITRLCKEYDLSISTKDDPELMEMTYSIYHAKTNLCYKVAFYKDQLIGLRGIDKEIYIYNKLLEGILNVIYGLGLDREKYTSYNGDL